MPLGLVQAGAVVGGRYVVDKKLAEGGIGVVFLATDQQAFNRVTVLKFPKEQFLLEPGFRERFAREGESLTRFSHPNVVAVYGVGIHQDIPFGI